MKTGDNVFMLRLIGFYQRWISPLLPPRCRFIPSCSTYAAEAIQLHGSMRGSAMAMQRICKCHPFHPGGFDPVPDKNVKATVLNTTAPQHSQLSPTQQKTEDQ